MVRLQGGDREFSLLCWPVQDNPVTFLGLHIGYGTGNMFYSNKKLIFLLQIPLLPIDQCQKYNSDG